MLLAMFNYKEKVLKFHFKNSEFLPVFQADLSIALSHWSPGWDRLLDLLRGTAVLSAL